jgi:ferric-dicitrate binding protein FerR (iron transport regulator)
VKIEADGSTSVTVLEGEVNLADLSGNSVNLEAGQSGSVSPNVYSQSQLEQSVADIDSQNVDNWWGTQTSSDTQNSGTLILVAAAAVVAVIAVLAVIVVLKRRKKKSGNDDMPLPPPPPPTA